MSVDFSRFGRNFALKVGEKPRSICIWEFRLRLCPCLGVIVVVLRASKVKFLHFIRFVALKTLHFIDYSCSSIAVQPASTSR